MKKSPANTDAHWAIMVKRNGLSLKITRDETQREYKKGFAARSCDRVGGKRTFSKRYG